nr:AraC family transcriptional regulator [Pseudodesulfovibrio alkaliphilus]
MNEALHSIRSDLEERHASPPTLAELSSKYHLPVVNIQAGFKSLFGMSAFAFVQEYRLQRARRLFVEGDMNVSEVAWDIGYTNLSHFSSAFRKRFGVLPKAYLQSVRERLHTPCRRSRP